MKKVKVVWASNRVNFEKELNKNLSSIQEKHVVDDIEFSQADTSFTAYIIYK